jgi:hypothetical protein
MKFTTPRAQGPCFKLANMAKEGNKPPPVATKELISWNLKQFIAFTLFGALSATIISSSLSTVTPTFLQNTTPPSASFTANPESPTLSMIRTEYFPLHILFRSLLLLTLKHAFEHYEVSSNRSFDLAI